MALNTKHIKVPEGKLNKTINPGNVEAKIYDLSLKAGYKDQAKDYDDDPLYLVFHVETAPIDDFEGFFIDPSDESKGRHLGQVGKVRNSQWACETKTLPSGIEINRDDSILKMLMTVAKAQDRVEALNEINADTIEEFVEKAKEVLCNDIFLNFCIAGKEYRNKEDYIAYDLYLAKSENKKYSITNNPNTLLAFNETKHILPEKKKVTNTVSEFEPTDNTPF